MTKPRKNRSRIITFLILAVALYVTGYGAARRLRWIVHHAGYYSDEKGERKIAGHEVVPGDFGTPLLSVKSSIALRIVSEVYLPARSLETLFWYILHPRGSDWPRRWLLESERIS